MKKVVNAQIEELRPLLEWIRGAVSSVGFSPSKLGQIELASEEVFVNIIHHAYQGKGGKVEVEVKIVPKKHIELRFKDQGPPFNPLELKEVDVDAELEEREIGGLGLSLIRKIVDEIRYTYERNQNVLTLLIRSL